MSRSPTNPKYLDPSLPVSERVQDLVSRMTLEEKVSQMNHSAPPIDRLGIPAYNWWNECLHGVGRAGIATVFPQAIGLAATWDSELIHEVASVISDEARAKYNDAIKRGMRDIYRGLTFWTPNINIFRDPRWGRGQETYGEDPHLTARMGVSFVKGLQGDHPQYLKLVATPKHYAVHSGPEADRHHFDAKASEIDLRQTYLPAFEATIKEGRAFSIMGAYNRTNGEACCASPTLLEDILRKEWGFEGYVVSDCGAIYDIHQNHKLVETSSEAAALAVKAGCDLCCGKTYNDLVQATKLGYITKEEITQSVVRLFTARFLLGMFDPEDLVPYSQIPISTNDSQKHRELALKSALESIVLLKNQNGFLPIGHQYKRIAIIGPNANDPLVLLGNYNGTPSHSVTPLDGIKIHAGSYSTIGYAKGCGVVNPSTDGFAEALDLARTSDLVIFIGGLSQAVEGEEGQREGVEGGGHSKGDRDDINLPGQQEALLKQLFNINPNIVLVTLNGSAIALNWADEHLPAIICAWYPGEEGGEAIAQVLFGKYNPGGRLPVTFYRSIDDLPPFDDYNMEGKTYRYFRKQPLYAFGHGLSYSQFKYSSLRLSNQSISLNDDLIIKVDVTNDGKRLGDEVVQCYIKNLTSSNGPALQLVGFQRITLEPGETKSVSIKLSPNSTWAISSSKDNSHSQNSFWVSIGGRQPEIGEEKSIHSDILFSTFTVKV